jgi:Uma2 family endonuclease
MVANERIAVRLPDPLHLEGWEEIDEPMATDAHNNEQVEVYVALRGRFAGPRCYVSMNRWLHMNPANPAELLLPDILVALDVPDRSDETHFVPSVEGKAPDLLIEFLSKDSLRADRFIKPARYGKVGVREYFVFNPASMFASVRARIQGWTLDRAGGKTSLPTEADGGVNSRVLPVRFTIQFDQLFVVDQETGTPISPAQEARLAYVREAAAHHRETARADAAEAENRRLRELLDQSH